MSGAALIGLVVLSMAWLFFGLGAALNFQAWRRAQRAGNGGRAPCAVPILPGVAGSLAMFFSIPALAGYGIELPWPWLWILLPLALDAGCLGWLLLAPFRRGKR
jgi:hypothetical protein